MQSFHEATVTVRSKHANWISIRLEHMENTMGRRVKHVHAGRNEYVKVHRDRPRRPKNPKADQTLLIIGIAIMVILFIRGC